MRATVDVGEAITVTGPDGPARAWWHPADGAAAVIALSGVGNDASGPSHVYPDLAGRLRAGGVATLRLEYRHAGHLGSCVGDVLAAIDHLVERDVRHVVLVGWSFGGAVAVATGATSGRVNGVATIASQTFGADAVARLAPRPLLVVHGTDDQILPVVLSERLYAAARDPRQLVL
ncbi:MAG: phospholipase, partial [Frankiales bacterium]|nr:phospholipase [Frankiales bacterium]